MADFVVVKSAVKNYVGDKSVASDFAEALNAKVIALIKDAVARAEGNSRKTIMAKDL